MQMNLMIGWWLANKRHKCGHLMFHNLSQVKYCVAFLVIRCAHSIIIENAHLPCVGQLRKSRWPVWYVLVQSLYYRQAAVAADKCYLTNKLMVYIVVTLQYYSMPKHRNHWHKLLVINNYCVLTRKVIAVKKKQRQQPMCLSRINSYSQT